MTAEEINKTTIEEAVKSATSSNVDDASQITKRLCRVRAQIKSEMNAKI